MSDTPAPTTLPCGCFINPVVTHNGTKELRVSPCRPDCKYLAMMFDLANEAEKPIERRYGR